LVRGGHPKTPPPVAHGLVGIDDPSRGLFGDPSGQDPQESGGVAGEASNSGVAEEAVVPQQAAPGGRARASGGATSTSAAGAAGQSASAASCPTYDDEFQPQINAPVCSKCHQSSARLADWGVYSQAKANCATIGSRVASGAMPPPRSGYTLSAARRSLVASWVRLGAQTASDLPSTCK
jgi:hypothetical protein